MRSPLMINIMLACHVSPDPEQFVGSLTWTSPAAVETRKQLVSFDLIDPDTNRATARGEVWVEAIINTPLPVHSWIIPGRAREHAS